MLFWVCVIVCALLALFILAILSKILPVDYTDIPEIFLKLGCVPFCLLATSPSPQTVKM